MTHTMHVKIIDFVEICKTEQSNLLFSLRGLYVALCFKPIKVLYLEYVTLKRFPRYS